MGSLIVLLVILGCVAFQYLKGTLVRSFALLITSICAGVVAFSYFEPLANILIGRKILISWAHTLSFLLLFILAFAGLQTLAGYLTRKPVDFGMLPERVGRVVFGSISGLILSGLLITALAMVPKSPGFPYQRFDRNNPNPEQSSGVLLNADGFATGWFSIISKASFSGKKSFAVLHPDFLDQIFLERCGVDQQVQLVTESGTLKIPQIAVWPASPDLKDTSGAPIPPKNGYSLTVVRVEITTGVMLYGKAFTFSQLRVICKQKDSRNQLAGRGINIYPIGYLKTPEELEMMKLGEVRRMDRTDFKGGVSEFDCVFYVPDGFVPALVEFKRNCVGKLPSPVKFEEAPPMQQLNTEPVVW